jgi:hypothetical protein
LDAQRDEGTGGAGATTGGTTGPAMDGEAARTGAEGGPIAIAGMAGRARAAAALSMIRVGTTAGAAAFAAGGAGFRGAAVVTWGGAWGGDGARCPIARGADGAGGLAPGMSGFWGPPSFGDFEKRLIPLLATIPVLRSRSLERARPLVDRVHITERSVRDAPIPPVAAGIQCGP